jgi:hypothetical protein
MEETYIIALNAKAADEVGLGTWLSLGLLVSQINSGKPLTRENGSQICNFLNNQFLTNTCSLIAS